MGYDRITASPYFQHPISNTQIQYPGENTLLSLFFLAVSILVNKTAISSPVSCLQIKFSFLGHWIFLVGYWIFSFS